MHDAAMKICDDVIVSDIPLMYGPGEVGLAALMIADEDLWNEAVPASIDGEGDGHYKRAKIDIL
jgi:cyclin H